jgi:flagellin
LTGLVDTVAENFISQAGTGVFAKVNENIMTGKAMSGNSVVKGTIFINGYASADITTALNNSRKTREDVVRAINLISDKTGVKAIDTGSDAKGITLSAADGRNIAVGTTGTVAQLGLTGITSAITAADATVFTSQVQLSSSNAFTLRAGSHGVPNLEALGFKEGTFGGSDSGLKVNQLDVSTVSGANQAISAIDAAINTVSAAQAKSGAINNRLDSIINYLAEGSKNMQASRSRIMDTDYAVETSNLAKQQIIQQAATAMLAQANQSSQSILSLLK